MDLKFSPEEEAFREEIADWLNTALSGPFRQVRYRGGSGNQAGIVGAPY